MFPYHFPALCLFAGIALLAFSGAANAGIHGNFAAGAASVSEPSPETPAVTMISPTTTLTVSPSVSGLPTVVSGTTGGAGTLPVQTVAQIQAQADASLGVVVGVVELSDLWPGSQTLSDLHWIKNNGNLSSTFYMDGAMNAIFGKLFVALEKLVGLDGNPHTSYDGIDFTLDPDGAAARSNAGGAIPMPGIAYTDLSGQSHDYSLPGDFDTFKALLNQQHSTSVSSSTVTSQTSVQ